MSSDRYYQLVLLWFKDPVKFERYCHLVAPIVTPYGSGLDRQFAPETIYAPNESLKRPDVVNLVYYGSRDAFATFARDEAFREILHLRTESTDLASIEGVSIRSATDSVSTTLLPGGDPKRRLYMIEIARFGKGGEASYREYERASEAVMARYGYRIERSLSPKSSSGLPFAPDIVKVAFFESPEGLEAFHRDEAHERLEKVLYPAATSESIWLVGKTTAP
jgi:uncharacterized protein (DUF1330 family)